MAKTSEIYRVLIIEDEYYLADDLAVALRSGGFEIVGPFCQLSEALSQVARGGFDAAVLDISLNGEFIYCLADELKMQRLPFVFATGYSADAVPTRFSDVTRFEKPCDIEGIARHFVQLSAHQTSRQHR